MTTGYACRHTCGRCGHVWYAMDYITECSRCKGRSTDPGGKLERLQGSDAAERERVIAKLEKAGYKLQPYGTWHHDERNITVVLYRSDTERATIRAPISELPRILFPLEMVEKAVDEIRAEFRFRTDLSTDAREAAIEALEQLQERLRSQLTGGSRHV